MRYAVIGMGRMGRRHIHASNLLNYELVGVYDKSEESIREAKLEHNINSNKIYKSSKELINISKPDLLIIATTADSHCELTCMASEHGVKYILVEKPMAVSLQECDLMISCCQKAGAILSINHQMRFMDHYIKPKKLLLSEKFGGFKSMTVVGGNIGMSMNGTHYFEAFRLLSDEDPFEVSAWFDSGIVANPRGLQFEDRSGSIRVSTATGKRLYIEIGADQGHGVEVIYAGRNGLISVNELSGSMLTNVRQLDYRTLPTTRYGMPADHMTYSINSAEVIVTTASVIEALVRNENRVTEIHGKKTIEVLVAAYESSARGGKTIKIDKNLDKLKKFPWA
jgi:predicted dehydrogenase